MSTLSPSGGAGGISTSATATGGNSDGGVSEQGTGDKIISIGANPNVGSFLNNLKNPVVAVAVAGVAIVGLLVLAKRK